METAQATRPGTEVALAAVDRLLYRGQAGWTPLPPWAAFFALVGEQLAAWNSPGHRVSVCLTIPTRSYAACLASLGAVAQSLHEGERGSSPVSHFEFLASLPVDHPVILRKKTQKLKGLLKGEEQRDGRRYLRVQLESLHARGGGLTELIQVGDSLRIRPADFELSSSDLPKNQKGRPVARHAPFVESLLQVQDVYDFVTTSVMSCAIVGSKRSLRAEAVEALFAVEGPKSSLLEGALNDALRAKDFLQPGEAYRTDILSASASEVQVDPLAAMAPLAIFDGANAYLRWRREFSSANSLVLLDRCQSGAEDAASAFIQEHAKRADDFQPLLDQIPAGVEVAGFIGAVR